jgi:microcystin-dependent protein
MSWTQRGNLKGSTGAQGPPGGLIGAPIPWLVSSIPSGYREFDGSAIVQATHPQLYALFGATMPDLRGLTLIGQGGSVGAAVGGTGGVKEHTLTEAQIPAHAHRPGSGQTYHTIFGAGEGGQTHGIQPTAPLNSGYTQWTGNTGGGAAHPNMPPYRAVRWITVAG